MNEKVKYGLYAAIAIGLAALAVMGYFLTLTFL